MSVDVRGSVVRLDLASFEELVSERPPGHAALRVPGVERAVAAVRDPVVRLAVDLAGPASRQQHRVWVDHEMSAFLLGVRHGEHHLVAVPPALVGAGLARVLRVGPRPAGTPATGEREPRPVPGALLEDLFADDEPRRGPAYDGLGAQGAWSLALSWAGGGRRVTLVEGVAGAWWAEGQDDLRTLVPTDPTGVWRVLSSLLASVPSEVRD